MFSEFLNSTSTWPTSEFLYQRSKQYILWETVRTHIVLKAAYHQLTDEDLNKWLTVPQFEIKEIKNALDTRQNNN